MAKNNDTERYVTTKDRSYIGDRAVYTYFVYDDVRKVRIGSGHATKAAAKKAAHYLNQTAAGEPQMRPVYTA